MDSKTLISIQKLNIALKLQTPDSLPLINEIDLQINEGGCSGISAPTGTGKTTLLNYIAGLLNSTQDEQQSFEISGTCQKIEGLKIAYAFQEPRLIPSVSVIKNVMLPLENLMDKQSAFELASLWLNKLNLSNKKDVFPGLLSGGEQQRAGLARAFAYSQAYNDKPCLLLLDEPFASQDQTNATYIKELILEQTKLSMHAALIISHDRPCLDSICTSIIS